MCTQVICDSCVQRGRSKSKPLGDGETLKGGLQNRSGGFGRTTLVLTEMSILLVGDSIIDWSIKVKCTNLPEVLYLSDFDPDVSVALRTLKLA